MFKKPWENGAAAYHEADSIAEAIKGFKRYRNTQTFILSDKTVAKGKIKCGYCGKVLTVKRGNRCHYFPKFELVQPLHYDCAWKVMLNFIHGPFYDKVMGR